ncbi:MAG: glycoside hydrolase family 127 protein [Acidobacteriaceae bacterium]|nr:glycoside hydrolase family 127 protein [Acidobacteriaceae bacterium]
MNHRSTYQLTRRTFAASLLTPALLAQPPAIHEEPPFAAPLTFRRQDAPRAVEACSMAEVRLLPGPFQNAADANRAYISRLPVDRLVHNFRVNAGLPSTAQPFGGWEAPKVELRGHFTGHYLSACALSYASSGDRTVKERGDEIVADLAQCQAKLQGGYLSAFPIEYFDRLDGLEKVWAPFYTVHKIMAGLYDMHVHTGNRQALEVVGRMADWADAWSSARSESHMQDILKNEYGGMNEVLYNVAAKTGEERWARAGDRFSKKTFFTPLAQHRDELRNLHANTHIPQVIGAARRYEISSDPRFHDVADFFWYAVASSRTYVTGGSSEAEHWRTEPGHLAAEMKAGADHQECCCSYNMMKLTRHLYEWTGDARYFDYYERNLFNHRLGTIQPGTGHTMYFLSMTPGAWKTVNSEDQSFWCCTGTGVEEYAKLNDSIYFANADGVFVNLFIPSELNHAKRGIRLRQETRFPYEPRTTLTVAAASAEPWTLHLRVPSWTKSASVKVNGKAVDVSASAGSYIKLARAWKQGDRIQLEMPMHLVAEMLPDDPSQQAFRYGPVVLAGDLGSEGLTDALIQNKQAPAMKDSSFVAPTLVSSGKPVSDWMVPSGAAPLNFRATGQSKAITLRPLNELWNRYAVYWTVS